MFLRPQHFKPLPGLTPLIRNYKLALAQSSGLTISQNASINERLSLQGVHSSAWAVTVSMNGELTTAVK